jgi:AcrR family transcriptional regulator
VTIAAVVGAAGCTPPSLYHYWASREQLVRDASGLGWARFAATQGLAAAEGADPLERIRRRGAAYVTFAQHHPALFRILFLGPRAVEPHTPGPASGSASASLGPSFLELEDDVTAAVTAGAIDAAGSSPRELAMVLWCAVHGLATLSLSAPGDADQLLEETQFALQRLILRPTRQPPRT